MLAVKSCEKPKTSESLAILQARQPMMRSLQDACAGARPLPFQGWRGELNMGSDKPCKNGKLDAESLAEVR